MRVDKYNLNESHPDVKSDRINGRSIWVGTSGSTMDIIYIAEKRGGLKHPHLTDLAHCVAAFFHFMPTVFSGTHTYHEVMRGAKTISKDIVYDPNWRPTIQPKPKL
jgi:hypothetical protein